MEINIESATGRMEPHTLAREHDPFRADMSIGASPTWRAVLKLARQVAATETTTCLQGESGTGKEVVAQLIYQASPRRRGPFVAINCAAVPDGLLESELFGFERGAFTGAQHTKPGHIELAQDGVLFLDEIADMPLTAQAKLLRVLQQREIVRLGGIRPIKVNARVVAATNQDLREAVVYGRFREDLYYRINVFEIRIPPLRDRGRDILLLAEHFLQDMAHSHGRPLRLTPRAEEALLAYQWPGNIRELRNVLERGAIVCEGPLVDAEHLALTTSKEPPTLQKIDLGVLEQQAITQALREVAGNKAKAAAKLGISRTQLYGRLRKYGLDHDSLLEGVRGHKHTSARLCVKRAGETSQLMKTLASS